MRQDGRTARPATATQGLPAMTNRHGDQPPDGPWRMPTDQTSTPESPAIGPSPKRRDRTGGPRRPGFRSQHESRPEDQTTDESDRADPETRSRGCSQVSLYNTRRPHQAARPSLANDDLARSCIRERGRGHDAALGQRWRVAHMPTAATATTTMRSLIW